MFSVIRFNVMKKIMEHERNHLREHGKKLHGSYPVDIDVDMELQQGTPLKTRSGSDRLRGSK